jgi:hypothetical protein
MNLLLVLELQVPEKRKGPHLIRPSFWLGSGGDDLRVFRRAGFNSPAAQEDMIMGALHTAPDPFYYHERIRVWVRTT